MRRHVLLRDERPNECPITIGRSRPSAGSPPRRRRPSAARSTHVVAEVRAAVAAVVDRQQAPPSPASPAISGKKTEPSRPGPPCSSRSGLPAPSSRTCNSMSPTFTRTAAKLSQLRSGRGRNSLHGAPDAAGAVVRRARRREVTHAHGCDAVAAAGRAYALIAPDGRVAVRLPDWDLFAAAFELPGSQPLYENEQRVGHWVLLPVDVLDDHDALREWLRQAHALTAGRVSGERALSFGSVAEDYEATRPGWPLEPFAEVLRHFGVRSSRCRRHRGRHGEAHADARTVRGHARRRRARRRASGRAPARVAAGGGAPRDGGGAAAGDGERRPRVRRAGLPLVRRRAGARRDRPRAASGWRRDRGLELAAGGRHLVRRRRRLPARRESRPPSGADARLVGGVLAPPTATASRRPRGTCSGATARRSRACSARTARSTPFRPPGAPR